VLLLLRQMPIMGLRWLLMCLMVKPRLWLRWLLRGLVILQTSSAVSSVDYLVVDGEIRCSCTQQRIFRIKVSLTADIIYLFDGNIRCTRLN
jgi:hypothetical protein